MASRISWCAIALGVAHATGPPVARYMRSQSSHSHWRRNGASDVVHGSRSTIYRPALPLEPAGAWPGRDDGDLQPAICLDIVRQAVPDGDRRHAAGDPDRILAADRAADLALAVPGLADRAL